MAHQTEDKHNPFEPDRPATPAYFAGRTRELQTCLRAMRATANGTPTSLLIVGERGIGKTSLARACDYVATEGQVGVPGQPTQFVSAWVVAEGGMPLNDVWGRLLRQLDTLAERAAWDSVRQWLRTNIRGVTVGSLGVTIDPQANGATVTETLAAAIHQLSARALAEDKSIMLIVDELDMMEDCAAFASSFRALWQHLTVSLSVTNVMFILVGRLGVEDQLAAGHPSLARELTRVHLPLMPPEEMRELFDEYLQRAAPPRQAEEYVSSRVCDLSQGYPTFLQELGYGLVEVDDDNLLDEADLLDALAGTAGYEGVLPRLGAKYFDRKMFTEIRSERPRDILRVLADAAVDPSRPQGWVQRRHIAELVGVESGSLSPYLNSLMDSGLVERDPTRSGHYRIGSFLLGLYVRFIHSIGPQLYPERLFPEY